MLLFKRILFFLQLCSIMNVCHAQEIYGVDVFSVPHIVVGAHENLKILKQEDVKIAWRDPFDDSERWMSAVKFLELSDHVQRMPKIENECLAHKIIFPFSHYLPQEDELVKKGILKSEPSKLLPKMHRDFFKSFGSFFQNREKEGSYVIKELKFKIDDLLKHKEQEKYLVILIPQGNGYSLS